MTKSSSRGAEGYDEALRWTARETSIAKKVLLRLTPRRAANCVRNYFERRARRLTLKSYPILLYFDVTNVCNLKCKLCPTGRRLPGYPKGFMSLELFKRIIDEMGGYALTAAFYNWGEPFLNKDIFAMINYAGAKGLTTYLSTSLHRMTEHQLRSLLDSRLDHLTVSLDGIDQESHSYYRQGGDFNAVVESLRYLVDHRKRNRPFIIWQYLVMKHNEALMGQAKTLADQIGVDLILYRPINLGDTPFTGTVDPALADRWLPSNLSYVLGYGKSFLSEKPCDYLWQAVFFGHDGTVNPCCDIYDQRHAFGRIDNEHRFLDVWNNEKYVAARSLFIKGGRPSPSTICARCRQFGHVVSATDGAAP